MILALNWPFFLLIARMILGETPALALLLAALLCWYAYLDRRRWPALALAGLGMGLAMAAKPQMLLLGPAFGLLGLLDLLYYRQLGLRHYLALGSLALVVLLVCYAYQVVNVGWDMYIRDTASASVSAGYFFNFDPASFWLRTGLGLNERTLLFLLILAALAWHVRRLRSRTIAGFKLAAPVIFCAVWVAWHTLLATNARYALIGYAIGMILVSGMLVELLPALSAQMHPTTRRLALGCVALLLALPLVLQIQFLQAEMHSGLDKMVAYIRAEVGAGQRADRDARLGHRRVHRPAGRAHAAIGALRCARSLQLHRSGAPPGRGAIRFPPQSSRLHLDRPGERERANIYRGCGARRYQARRAIRGLRALPGASSAGGASQCRHGRLRLGSAEVA